MAETAAYDILITGGTLVPMDASRRVIPDGALGIRGNSLAFVGARGDLPPGATGARTLDARGKVIIPGLINAHSHLAMTLLRGYSEDRPLEKWLETVWKIELAHMDAATVRAGTELAIVEMIRGGTTCAHDMYWHADAVGRAAIELGFRLANGPVLADIIGHTLAELEAEARAYFREFSAHPRLHGVVQTHSVYAAPPEMLAKTRDLAREYDLALVTHASESRQELATVREKFGKTPIEVLHELELLGPKTLLAHCIHLNDDEIATLAATGTSVAHCPECNLKIGSGIARVVEMAAAGVNVAVATDGPASNNDLDMFSELRTAAILQKGVRHDPTVMPAAEVFAMGTRNAARALGIDNLVGSLEVGKRADVVLLNFDKPHLTPVFDVYAHLIYSVNKADVETVLIEGEIVLENGAFTRLDEAAILARAREAVKVFG
jgi:5-methylthioadenosine/S-adenosylhomocysteine deaminase